MKLPIRVAVITNIIPAYRRDYFQRIFDNPSLDVTVFCQATIPGLNLTSIHREFGSRVVEVPYYGARRELIGWQQLPLGQLFGNFDIYFVHGNPRILSNVLVSLLLRLAGKPVVIEGQLHTGGSRKFPERIRLAWWSLFRFVYLYNEAEIPRLRQMRGFRRTVAIGMNNGLDQELIEAACAEWSAARLDRWRTEQQLEGALLLLSCARLEEKNRFDWMVVALPELRRQHPQLVWCVIGDGDQRQALQSKATAIGVSDAIRWLGPLYDEAQLAPWFLSAEALVHPGSIGLSLLHAFGHGLPVVTHDNIDQHMPEYAALQPDVNGVTYRYGDLASLTNAINQALKDNTRLAADARLTAQTRFNTRIMAERFEKMCRLAAPRVDGSCA